MSVDRTVLSALSAVLKHDLESIQRIDSELQRLTPALNQGPVEFRDLAAISYLLHNIYNALENTFDQISRTFENHIVDPARWHRELLDKMFLEIPEIRPAVLPENVRKLTHELRGFRHLFRHGYDFEIDAVRLQLLIHDWDRYKLGLIKAVESFREFLLRSPQSES